MARSHCNVLWPGFASGWLSIHARLLNLRRRICRPIDRREWRFTVVSCWKWYHQTGLPRQLPPPPAAAPRRRQSLLRLVIGMKNERHRGQSDGGNMCRGIAAWKILVAVSPAPQAAGARKDRISTMYSKLHDSFEILGPRGYGW